MASHRERFIEQCMANGNTRKVCVARFEKRNLARQRLNAMKIVKK